MKKKFDLILSNNENSLSLLYFILITHCTNIWKKYPQSSKFYLQEITKFLLYREPIVELEDGDFSEYILYNNSLIL